MSNHPNRSPQGLSRNPDPEEIKEARQAAGLTQTAAAALVHTTCRTWQQWEAGDRRMHPAMWELYLIKRVKPIYIYLDGFVKIDAQAINKRYRNGN